MLRFLYQESWLDTLGLCTGPWKNLLLSMAIYGINIIPLSSTDSVMIQFPDPHFKKKHRKRRIFQPDLVKAICDLLPPGGQLFLQSDVKMVRSLQIHNLLM
jgi:tRNA G46 methylase TrmB